MKKKTKLSTDQNKADVAMSLYIRQKYAVDGYVTCVSCGISIPWKDADCGHFIPKSRGASVRYIEENAHPECHGCNRFNEGHLIGYTQYMINMYGSEMIEHLKAESRKTLSPTEKRKIALEALEYYKQKLLELG